MSDIEKLFDAFVSDMNKISLRAQLSDYINRARELSIDKCGDCLYWMCSDLCPQEKNINGRYHGPSMSGAICQKFFIKKSSVCIKKEAKKEANQFAIENGFKPPFPND